MIPVSFLHRSHHCGGVLHVYYDLDFRPFVCVLISGRSIRLIMKECWILFFTISP